MIDLDGLLKLRLVVARYGEMDRAGWWNTRGMLGRYGAMAVERGLPRTHRFARARVVFAVARLRCDELFKPPESSVTLWKLPAEIEDQFDEQWHGWLAASDDWRPLFDDLAESHEADLLTQLVTRKLISSEEIESIETMRRSAGGHAVQLPDSHTVSDGLVTLLAGAFAKGERGAPAIPYARLAE